MTAGDISVQGLSPDDMACPPMTRTVPCRSFCKLSGRTATYHRFMATLKHRSALHVVPHTAPRIDIGISEPNRRKIATGLGRLLADTYTLYLKTHNFHWNVTKDHPSVISGEGNEEELGPYTL